MVAHPERHVGEHGRGDDVRGGLEDRLHPRAVVGLDGEVSGHAAARGEQQRRAHAEEHVPEVLPVPEPVQVREQDGDDHARLDALAKEDDQRCEHNVSR